MPSPVNLDYAIVQAAEGAANALMLSIEHRPGRGPVRLLSAAPEICWVCADGREEALRRGTAVAEARYAQLQADIAGKGLLVAEFAQEQPAGEPLAIWLLGPHGELE